MAALSLNKFAQEGRTLRVVLCVGIGMLTSMAALLDKFAQQKEELKE